MGSVGPMRFKRVVEDSIKISTSSWAVFMARSSWWVHSTLMEKLTSNYLQIFFFENITWNLSGQSSKPNNPRTIRPIFLYLESLWESTCVPIGHFRHGVGIGKDQQRFVPVSPQYRNPCRTPGLEQTNMTGHERNAASPPSTSWSILENF